MSPDVLTAALRATVEKLVDERLQQRGATAPVLEPRALRIRSGLTLERAATAAGISHSTLSRIEAGLIRNPDPATLNKIAAALGIGSQEYRASFAHLLQRTEETP